VNTHEHDDWTVYPPAVCLCVDARLGEIPTNGGKQSVFILEFFILETEQSVTKFFNVRKTPKGDYAAPHDSDFAKLHRLVTGEYNKARYSRAQQLLKHMIGHEYIVEYGSAVSSQGLSYLKAKTVKPVDPVVTNAWYPSGKLIPKQRHLNSRKTTNRKVAMAKQRSSNELAIEQQKSNNDLAMEKAATPHFNWGLSTHSIPLEHTTLKHNHVEPCKPDSIDEYETTMILVGSVNNFQYYQRPDESEDDYHDRVFDESGILK